MTFDKRTRDDLDFLHLFANTANIRTHNYKIYPKISGLLCMSDCTFKMQGDFYRLEHFNISASNK